MAPLRLDDEEQPTIPLSLPRWFQHKVLIWLLATRRGTFVLGLLVGTLVTLLGTCALG